jgi:hypothetical protein
MATRDELVVALIERYARGGRLERGRILDEFTAVTGFIGSTRCDCCEKAPWSTIGITSRGDATPRAER